MLDELLQVLDEVEAAGVTVRRGVPAPPDQIAALQEQLGCTFPADYTAFLGAVGALQLDHLPEHTVFGHAPGDDLLDLPAATSAVRASFGEWGHDEVPVTPVAAIQHFPTESWVLDAEGKLLWLRRGRLHDEGGTFLEHLISDLRKAVGERAADTQTATHIHDVIAALREVLPPDLVQPHDGPGLLLRRPSDGTSIRLRFGDGRELRGARGIYVAWQTEEAPDAEALNAWNLQARFVRGAARPEGGVRYRGLLPAEGLEPRRLVAAIGHDADLPLPSDVPEAPSLDAVADGLGGSTTLTPAQRLLAAFGGAPETQLRREGEALLLTSPGDHQCPKLELRVTVGPLGLVHAEHRHPSSDARTELLAVTNGANGARGSRSDANYDMENMTRLGVDGDDVVYRFTTTVQGLAGAWRHQVKDLEWAASRAGLLPPVDERLAWDAAVSSVVGCPVGPATRALLRALPFMPHQRLREPLWLSGGRPAPDARDTPWGAVVPFLRMHDVALDREVEIGLARGTAETSDELPVVGFDGDRAVRLADGLPAWLTVAVLGISGIDWHGDALRTWHHYRDLVRRPADLAEHYFTCGDELCRTLDVRPASDPGAVLHVHPDLPSPPPARPTPPATDEGHAALEEARAVVDGLRRSRAGSDAREAWMARRKGIQVGNAVEAVAAFIDRHGDRVELRHGDDDDAVAQLTATHGKLPVLTRRLLDRFGGWLELRLRAADGPLGRTRDGLRVLGVAPEHPPCDLAAQLVPYRTLVDGLWVSEGDRTAAKRSEALQATVPVVTSLAGPRSAWVGRGTKVDVFHERDPTCPHDHRDLPTHPRMGVPFAFVARLVELERRLEELTRLEALEALAAELGATSWDARGHLRLARHPDVTLRVVPSPRSPDLFAVAVERRLQQVPVALGVLDPRVEERLERAQRALARGSFSVSLPKILRARTDRLLTGLTGAELAGAVAQVERMAAAFAADRFEPWDEDPAEVSDDVAALLAEAGADETTLAARVAEASRGPGEVRVAAVGTEEPRVRWSWRPANGRVGFGHTSDPWARMWEPVERGDGAWFEAELPLAGLTVRRLEELMTAR